MNRFMLIAVTGALIASGCQQSFAQAKIKRDGRIAPANSDQMNKLNLQKQMNKSSKGQQTISNVSKRQSDTASPVIRKQ